MGGSPRDWAKYQRAVQRIDRRTAFINRPRFTEPEPPEQVKRSTAYLCSKCGKHRTSKEHRAHMNAYLKARGLR